MKMIFAESIQKKVILITVLSVLSFFSFFVVDHFVFDKNIKVLDNEIKNQTAKLEIGNLISKEINLSHLNIAHLLNSSNVRDYKIYKDENDLLFKRIFKLLSIIQNGGSYKYKIECNLNKSDFIEKKITYKKPVDEGIVIEVINLSPRIKNIQNKLNEFLALSKRYLSVNNLKDKQKIINKINIEEKKIHTLYVRALEDVGKIFFEVEIINDLLKKQKKIYNLRNQIISLSFFSVLAALIIIISIILINQIQIILKEKAENQNRYKALSEATNEAIIFTEKNRVIDINKAAIKITGYSYDESIGINLINFIAPESRELVKQNLLSGSEKFYDVMGQMKDGTKKDLELHSKIFEYNGKKIKVTAIRDISERKRSEKQLQKYAETQKTLVQEVNHRVKNNLMAIISLMKKEQDVAQTKGLSSLSVVENLTERIGGLATIHSLLSKNEWQPLRLTKLCEQIINGRLNNLHSSQKIDLNIEESKIYVNSNQAHQLTLILNELATNTIKYALLNRQTAKININIKQNKKTVHLSYLDDGPGYPQEIIDGHYKKTGVGFELIRGITTYSLSGELKIENQNGAKTIIIFKNEIEKFQKEEVGR